MEEKAKVPTEAAAELCSLVKVAPSFVLSSHRISTFSFLLFFWYFDVEAVRCSWVLSAPQSGFSGLSLASPLRLLF